MLDQFIVLRNGRVEALDDDKRPAPTLWPVSSDAKTVCCPLAEARLVRAYLALFLVPWTEGAKAVRLARFGAYEVRLVEIAHDPAVADGFPLWLELYAHDVRMSLDSCGCEAFDDAVSAADELIERASALHLLGRR